MFQTLQPQIIRHNKTALPVQRKFIYLNLNHQQRPNTMAFDRQFMSITPKQNLLKTIDDAQIQLNHSFRKQMSPYIKQKIRNSLSRNQQKRLFFSRTSSYFDNPEQQMQKNHNQHFDKTYFTIQNSSSIKIKPINFFNLLNRQIKSPFKNKQLISQSIITNTKQKIDRLIDLKRQKEQKYNELKKSIQKKCSKLKKNIFRKMTFINPQKESKPPNMQTLEWDQKWQQQSKKQSTRYRNRLIAKHKRDMSMKIQINQDSFKLQ